MTAENRRQYRSGAVFQRKDGMWIGRFEVGTDSNGNRRRIEVSAVSEARCKEKLEEKKLEVARAGVPEKLTGKRVTVESWCKDWLEMIVRDLRPSAYRATASTVKKWIIPTIGRKRLVQLSPSDIRSVFDAQRKAGLVESSRIRAHSDIMQMLKAAKLEGHDFPDRCLLVKKPKVGETDREAIPLDQCLSILGVVAKRPDASKWAAALLQGQRQGERLGLTWDCIDFDNDLIDISWQLQALPYVDNKNKRLGFRIPDGYVARHLVKSWHLVRPKSKKSRRITPMVPWMRNSLLAWREVAPTNEYGLVWAASDGLPARTDRDRDEWKAIQEAAGIAHPAGRHYVLHEARHSTATLLLELGVPREVVEAILGHSKLVEAYDHADRLPAQRKALADLAAKLELSA